MEERIQEIQSQFYSTSGKNMFFKRTQKLQCAQAVASELTPQILLENTFKIIPNTNRIFVNYPMFKTFMCPETYKLSIDYILEIGQMIVQQYGTLEVHIDVQSFTPTAAERYKDFVVQICKECEVRNTNFSEYLTKMNIYNCPALADHVARMIWGILPVETRSKVNLFQKDVSPELINQLFV